MKFIINLAKLLIGTLVIFTFPILISHVYPDVLGARVFYYSLIGGIGLAFGAYVSYATITLGNKIATFDWYGTYIESKRKVQNNEL